ncbi:hypothetical protein CR513_57710, partial [Mucuna pruriens]
MASNTQLFKTREARPSQAVNEVGAIDHLRLENQLTELTSLVRQLAVGQYQLKIPRRVCRICTSVEFKAEKEYSLSMWNANSNKEMEMGVNLLEPRRVCFRIGVGSTLWSAMKSGPKMSVLEIIRFSQDELESVIRRLS